MHFVNIGFDTLLDWGRVVSIIDANRNFARRFSKEARERGMLVDCSQGRKWGSLLFLENGQVYTSIVKPRTLVSRARGGEATAVEPYEEESTLPVPGKRVEVDPDVEWEHKGAEMLEQLAQPEEEEVEVPSPEFETHKPEKTSPAKPQGKTLLEAMAGDKRYA